MADWERRALAAEAEVARLKARVRELEAENDVLAMSTTPTLCDEIETLRVEGAVDELTNCPAIVIENACEGSNCVAIELLSQTSCVVSGANKTLVRYDNGERTHALTLTSPAVALRRSSRGSLAATTMDGSLYVLDESLEVKTRHKHHTDKVVVDCDWSPDGRYLATCGRDKSVVLYDKTIKDRSFVLPNSPECVRFLDDSTLVVAARNEPFLRYVDLATMAETRVSLNASVWDTHVSFDVLSLAVSPDRKYLAVATSKHRHVVYRARENAHVRVLTGHASDDFANTRIAWLGPGHDSLVSSSTDTSLHQWDFATGKRILKLDAAHAMPVRNLATLPSLGILATTSFDKAAKLWRTAPTRPAPTAVPSTLAEP
mmetsp:Transcript_11740/g.37366  ORF Transcript_11740/g.37366 Transcript_11740/m.37366 type:complete len:373 (+) Transcript_11740:27-1145(+)